MRDTTAEELEIITPAVHTRLSVDPRALTIERVKLHKRHGVWRFTAVGYRGETVVTGHVEWKRRIVVKLDAAPPTPATAAPVAPAGVPDTARMAILDYDGLAAYALELLDAGDDTAALAVYDEMDRREAAERADQDITARQRAAAAVDRRPGETIRDAMRREYDAWVADRYAQAERDTAGHMLSPRGRAAGTRPVDLFEGPAHVARAHASEDLLRWFAENGRMTFGQWTAQYGNRSARQALALSGNGRDWI